MNPPLPTVQGLALEEIERTGQVTALPRTIKAIVRKQLAQRDATTWLLTEAGVGALAAYRRRCGDPGSINDVEPADITRDDLLDALESVASALGSNRARMSPRALRVIRALLRESITRATQPEKASSFVRHEMVVATPRLREVVEELKDLVRVTDANQRSFGTLVNARETCEEELLRRLMS